MNLLIVGRGPSAFTFDHWDEFPDMMAVSSGIYAIPEDHRPPAHFVTMDSPKWFMHPLHEPDNDHAWQADVENWNFWKDERIAKHVPECHDTQGGYRELPPQLWDVIPDEFIKPFQKELGQNLHLFGHQAGWGDFPNVVPWDRNYHKPPAFGLEGCIGMKADKGLIRNTWFFAVQIAARLGYRRLHFIGCDFRRPEYALADEWAREWWAAAEAAGMEWINLSPDSMLDDIIPTECGTCPVPG